MIMQDYKNIKTSEKVPAIEQIKQSVTFLAFIAFGAILYLLVVA